MDPVASRLFVCYVPGFDRRRISAERTPFVEQLLATGPAVGLETLLGTDHLPTIVTGARPHEHRTWQVSLRPQARIPRRPGLTDRVPGAVSTTLQSLRHLVDRSYHLPTLPSRRRRQFDIHRAGFSGTGRGARAPESIGGYATVFGVIADSRFLFTRRLEHLEKLADRLPSGQSALEVLEIHALDLIQHWHMDSPDHLGHAYRAVDAFLRELRARCEERGVTLMLLSDHGQEPVLGTIPLVQQLHSAPVVETEYSYFCELALARFWFHTEEARARLTHMLRQVPRTRMLTLKELRGMNLLFEDDGYGELFLSADPGWVFFPNDHYHPLNSLALALADRDQRPRLFNPRPRGAHGYLPEHSCERGFAIVADPRFRARHPSAELIDMAPTMLKLMGEVPPSYMRGRAIFG